MDNCPVCEAEIDLGDPQYDCGHYDEQETPVHCPACRAPLIVTTHIEYTVEIADPS